MGIETGFGSSGFVDDRAEKETWAKIEKKLSGKKSFKQPEEPEENVIDGNLEMPDTPVESDWKAEMQISNKRRKLWHINIVHSFPP